MITPVIMAGGFGICLWLLSRAVVLTQHNDVTVLDIDPDHIGQVNRRESTVADPDIEAFLKPRELNPLVVGICRLVIKQGSDNFKGTAIQGIMRRLKAKGVKVVIYEPTCETNTLFHSKVLESLDEIKRLSDVIISNRMHKDLSDVPEKVFTQDFFGCDYTKHSSRGFNNGVLNVRYH